MGILGGRELSQVSTLPHHRSAHLDPHCRNPAYTLRYVAETGSSRLRAKTAGFSAAGGVVIGLIFSTSVPYMLNASYANWGLKTTFFFAGISAPLCIASWWIMPDTSRRTPAELDEMFEKKIRPWR